MSQHMKLGIQRRNVNAKIESTKVDPDKRTITFSFSSEEPVQRWWGSEVLSHEAGAPDLTRANNKAPCLFNHDMDDIRGVIEKAWLGNDKRCYCTVRYARTPEGDKTIALIDDEILTNVSFAYRIIEMDILDAKSDEPVYVATRWEVLEVSNVTIPADNTVGIGRSASDEEFEVRVRDLRTPAVPPKPAVSVRITMSDEQRAAELAAQKQRELEHTQTVEGERKRIQEVEAIGKKYGLKEEVVRGLIQKGATPEQARGVAADMILEQSKKGQQPASMGNDPANLGLTRKENSEYSILRAVLAMIDPQIQAGFERECSNEISKRIGRGTGGFFIPTDLTLGIRGVSEHRLDQLRTAYNTNSPSLGGNLVPINLLSSSFIDLLRNKAGVMIAGAVMLSGLTGNVAIPRQSGTGTIYWVSEQGAGTFSNATFDQVTLSPKTAIGLQEYSRQQLIQGSPDIEMLARNDLVNLFALGVDLTALSGTGSGGQPQGIANISNTGSVLGGTDGALITIDHLIDLETQLTSTNADLDSLAYLSNAKIVGALKKSKSTTGQYLWTNSPTGTRSATPGDINGYQFIRSNQARSNLTKGASSGICSEVFFGAWSQLLIGEWGVLELLSNPYETTAFTKGNVQVRAIQTIDIAVRHPEAFAVMSDAKIT
jgi:HK97 family phage major capsid protein/HK97 family phage prohead protease